MDLSNATCGVNISAVSVKAPVKAAGGDTITTATRPDTYHSVMFPREAPSQLADSSKRVSGPERRILHSKNITLHEAQSAVAATSSTPSATIAFSLP